MAKKLFEKCVNYIPLSIITLVCLWGFIFNPEKIGDGVLKGLILCGEKVIPSLFPFMVFASSISKTTLFNNLSSKTEKITKRLFKISGIGFTSVILGLLGGYPVGAKAVYDLYSQKRISENEARRLFCWCANPSPAFVISAVGVFMFSSYQSGIILYISSLISSFLIGFITRFFADKSTVKNSSPQFIQPKNIFINAVSETGEAILGICGWLLTFCAITTIGEMLIRKKEVICFIKSISEVTSGCQNAARESLPIPIVGAILGFGGFAVIFQIMQYIKAIGIPLKIYICIKALNGALNAFFCSVLLRIFPQSTTVSVTINTGSQIFHISHSIITAIILLIMCTVFILEVDNKRKVC